MDLLKFLRSKICNEYFELNPSFLLLLLLYMLHSFVCNAVHGTLKLLYDALKFYHNFGNNRLVSSNYLSLSLSLSGFKRHLLLRTSTPA
jgi:hypothetical protein